MPYRTRTYKRDELYNQVWSEPMTKVASRYGVSDVALAKMCRQLDVPLPSRGYWQKLAAGQRPERAGSSSRARIDHRAVGPSSPMSNAADPGP